MRWPSSTRETGLMNSTTTAMRGWAAALGVAGLVSGCGGTAHRVPRVARSVDGVSHCLRSAGFDVTAGSSAETLIGRLPPSPPRVLLDVTMPNGFPATVAFYSSKSAAGQAAAALGKAPPIPVVTAGRVDVVYLALPSEPTTRHRQTIEHCALGTARRTAYNRHRSDAKPAPPTITVPPAPHPTTPAANRGRALVGQSGCLACHQIGSAGNNGPGANLGDIGQRLSSQALRHAVINPRAPMPSFGSLPNRQVRDIVAYLASLRGHPVGRACVKVPRSIPENRLLASGAKRVVPVAATVYAAIVEPEEYASPKYPQSFPWLTPKSSDPAVLTPERACPSRGASTLAESVTVFRATNPGRSSLIADLRRQWRSIPDAPHRYHARVVVQRP